MGQVDIKVSKTCNDSYCFFFFNKFLNLNSSMWSLKKNKSSSMWQVISFSGVNSFFKYRLSPNSIVISSFLWYLATYSFSSVSNLYNKQAPPRTPTSRGLKLLVPLSQSSFDVQVPNPFVWPFVFVFFCLLKKYGNSI